MITEVHLGLILGSIAHEPALGDFLATDRTCETSSNPIMFLGYDALPERMLGACLFWAGGCIRGKTVAEGAKNSRAFTARLAASLAVS